MNSQLQAQTIVRLESQLSAYRFAVALFVGQMTGIVECISNGSIGKRENIVKWIDEAVAKLHDEKAVIFAVKESN